ncbi:zinc finger protein ZPR1 [Microplitis demolitor]|uniref:zinc finger protein ZPR1 n=1 Tax=Microplitis demolitor TaxID=69319 RepID=UPI0004CCB9F1|nr:zinc finger protein ZPR1 [Microplitis demolitor]
MTEVKKEIEELKQPIFQSLSADNPETTTIESLCVNCGKNGETRLLLTKIPHYKEIVLMSFSCDHCGFENNEIQNPGKINDKGIKIKLTVSTNKDLNRQVVKSDYTSIKIPKLDFEIPSQSQKGEITTIEGIIDRSIEGLEQDQPKRREENPQTAIDIDLFIAKLRGLKVLDEPFEIIFEDISGETHVENPNAPHPDKDCKISHFVRSEAQDKLLGIYAEYNSELLKPADKDEFTYEDMQSEVLQFPTNCPDCNCPCSTNMKLTKIPHFKEVVIMATNCESCGHRTNEVKSGSGIEPEGVKIEVLVRGKDDFSRDVLKSDTCSMEIPELELEVGPAALGGRFTTVEGVLTATKEQLTSGSAFGDSKDEEAIKRMNDFIVELDKVLNGERKVTIIFDDPAGNSYVQSLADVGCDEGLKVEKYIRSEEQNDELGLSDMKVENY